MADAELQKSNIAAGQAASAGEARPKKQEAVDVTKLLSSFGGFNAIRGFLPDADNLNPARKAAKAVFLSDKRFKEKRDNLINDIKGWLEVLDEGHASATEFVDSCKQKEEKYSKVLSQGITDALYATQNLERSYRELDSFFKTANTDKVKNLRIINVYKDDIADSDSGFAQEVENLLRGGFDRLSLKDCYSLLVVPGNVFQDKVTLLQWAKIAFKYKVMLITDHADEYSYDDLFANTESYRDSDMELQNVVMTSNWIVGRESEKLSEDEKESPAFFIAPSAALAGKLYDESANMAQGAGGKKYGTLDGVKGVRLDLLKSEIASLMDNQVIPMVYSEGRVMAFNNTTLYNGDNAAMKEYPIVRVFDWVKKVLMNYVHEVALENWDPYNSPKNLKSKIQAFLNDYKGYGNLFQNYEIKEPTQDPVTKRITCDISLTPFYSAKNFVIKVSADKKDKEAQMA
ncbi:MAG: type VI secretion system contractile sheath protein TssC [Parabacteroides sp.]